MTKFEIRKKFSLISAICYTVFALYNIISQIIFLSKSHISASYYKYYYNIDIIIIFWIAVLGLAVTLFTKNKKAVAAAAGVNACVGVYACLIEFIRNQWMFYLFMAYAGVVMAYASVVALIILSLKGNVIVKKIWFIPAAAMLLGCIFGWFSDDGHSRLWMSMVFSIIGIVALLFAGMWIKEDATPAQAAPVNEYATFDPQAMYSAPASTSVIGGADKLKMYKDLLESGAITQEDFDAKKKQILGL